jgi:hypothetical protein
VGLVAANFATSTTFLIWGGRTMKILQRRLGEVMPSKQVPALISRRTFLQCSGGGLLSTMLFAGWSPHALAAAPGQPDSVGFDEGLYDEGIYPVAEGSTLFLPTLKRSDRP